MSHPSDRQHPHPCHPVPQQLSARGSRPFASFIPHHGPATFAESTKHAVPCSKDPRQPPAESNRLVTPSSPCCGPGHDLPTSPVTIPNNCRNRPTDGLPHPSHIIVPDTTNSRYISPIGIGAAGSPTLREKRSLAPFSIRTIPHHSPATARSEQLSGHLTGIHPSTSLSRTQPPYIAFQWSSEIQ
jgi:hypothetical protein